MAKKGNRVQVILECIEQKESGMPGMSRYITARTKKHPKQDGTRSTTPILKRVTVHPRNQIRLNHGKRK